MDREITKPDNPPRTGTQAFSPLGCFLAASGVTMLAFCKLGAAMVATVWAASKLFGLPDFMMYGLMALGAVPVLFIGDSPSPDERRPDVRTPTKTRTLD